MPLKLRTIPGLLGMTAALAIGCTLAPTATPTPTLPPTPLPSPSFTPDARLASPLSLTDTAMTYLTELAAGLGPRASATNEEQGAAEYLATQFSDLGYSVELQPFPVEKFSTEKSGLALRLDDGTERMEVAPLSGSSFGQVSGVLTLVGLGRSEDIPEEGLEGKIALAERGLITFERKARNARAAGASGLVIYNNADGSFRGNLAHSSDIPVVAITKSDGQRLASVVADGDLEATITLETEEVLSGNVIAERTGTGDGIVVIGAHYDTVPNVSGANDNASGTAVVLTLAKELSTSSLPFSVRFIAFGSEELGLLGSRAYVDSLSSEEQKQIIAMLNFDALGSGTTLVVLGDLKLTDLVVEQSRLQGIDVKVGPGLQGGSSDHASFARVGIPVVMFTSDDTSRIHTPEDTLASINSELPGGAARLGLALLDRLVNPQ